MRTAQQIADAAAKRRITQAHNKANGIPTVRQARAAARAAKAAASGQPFNASTSQQTSAPPPRPSGRRRRTRFSNNSNVFGGSTTAPKAPIFAPKPSTRALKLAALVALEAVFTQKLQESGITEDIRHSYATYKKLKTLALGTISNVAMQNEADSALRIATAQLVKLAF